MFTVVLSFFFSFSFLFLIYLLRNVVRLGECTRLGLNGTFFCLAVNLNLQEFEKKKAVVSCVFFSLQILYTVLYLQRLFYITNVVYCIKRVERRI